MNNISVGFNVAMGTVTVQLYHRADAALDRARPSGSRPSTTSPSSGRPTQDTVGRFRIGGGMYIGPNSTIGGAFRIGGGASFLNTNRLGIGLDLVLEGGGYQRLLDRRPPAAGLARVPLLTLTRAVEHGAGPTGPAPCFSGLASRGMASASAARSTACGCGARRLGCGALGSGSRRLGRGALGCASLAGRRILAKAGRCRPAPVLPRGWRLAGRLTARLPGGLAGGGPGRLARALRRSPLTGSRSGRGPGGVPGLGLRGLRWTLGLPSLPGVPIPVAPVVLAVHVAGPVGEHVVGPVHRLRSRPRGLRHRALGVARTILGLVVDVAAGALALRDSGAGSCGRRPGRPGPGASGAAGGETGGGRAPGGGRRTGGGEGGSPAAAGASRAATAGR